MQDPQSYSSMQIKSERSHNLIKAMCLDNSSVQPKKKTAGRKPARTRAEFKLREGARPIRQMDTSDLQQLQMEGRPLEIEKARKSDGQALALAPNSSLPPHLLMASLLEQLCFLYVPDKNKAQRLFKILCERLSKLKVIAPLSHLDEMSSLRFQHRAMFNKLMRTAIKSLEFEQGKSLLALPSTTSSMKIERMPVKEDVIGHDTSRYRNEFRELGYLGKGGFGSVVKAKNHLDGREYAVKKIRFRHRNTEMLWKLLREVKALAYLQHTNIVGYNAAWMEYDSPFSSSGASSSNDSPRTDSVSATDVPESIYMEKQQKQNSSMSLSIEFCLSDSGEAEVPKRVLAPERQHRPLVGGVGLAMNAKVFSTVKVQELSVLNNHDDNIDQGNEFCKTRLKNNPLDQPTHFVDSRKKLDHNSVDVGFKTHFLEESIPSSIDIYYPDNNSSNHLVEDELSVCFEEKLNVHTEDNLCIVDSSKKVSENTELLLNQISRKGHKHFPPKVLKDASNSAVNGNHTSMSNGFTAEVSDIHEILPNSFSISSSGFSLQANSPVEEDYDKQWTVGDLHNVHFEDFSSRVHRDKSENLLCEKSSLFEKEIVSIGTECMECVPVFSHSVASYQPSSFLNSDNKNKILTAAQSLTLDMDNVRSGEHKYVSTSAIHTKEDCTKSVMKEPKALIPVLEIPSEVQRTENEMNTSDEKFLSRLKHRPFKSFKRPCVLRRHSSFPGQSADKNVSFMDDSSSDSYSVQQSVTFSSQYNQQDMVQKARKPKVAFRRSISSSAAIEMEEVMESRNHNYDFQNSITLYIQMELCSSTLQEWLAERNDDFLQKGYDEGVLCRDNLRIFRQVLEGADFIHSHGLIHRDLKPRNIFLNGDNLHVKIGDFGLAKEGMLSPGSGDIILSPTLKHSHSGPASFTDNHTTGVGTSAYASPEQLNASLYDFKSDMYSLGVILYEIFHVYNTEMERVRSIQQLREFSFCEPEFKEHWPLQVDAVLSLTHSSPCARPTARDLLCSPLFLSSQEEVNKIKAGFQLDLVSQIKQLQQTVLQQKMEMERLKKQLMERDKTIAQLQRDLSTT